MSEAGVASRPADARAGRFRRPGGGTLARVAVVLVAVVLPFYLSTSLLQTGLFCFSAVIGAIGLNLLTGTTGQLSLAHAFFVAVGAYGYSWLAGRSEVVGTNQVSGLHLPPLVAVVAAVVLAGVAGLAFSPVAGRLRGIYLGVASIALVFIGQHVMFNASSVTGGFNGRNVTTLDLFGFSFGNDNPPLYVLGVRFGTYERLWYLALVLAVLSYLFARNVLAGRPGRAWQNIRDSEVAAATLGVDVRRYKASAFVLSSMYAGLAGVLYALAFGRIVPDAFDLVLSINFLAMIIIGGLGSVGGAAIGAVFVTALPQLLSQYSDKVGFLASPGSGGIDPGSFARYVYGALIIAVILFEPGGLVALGHRLRRRGVAPPTALDTSGSVAGRLAGRTDGAEQPVGERSGEAQLPT